MATVRDRAIKSIAFREGGFVSPFLVRIQEFVRGLKKEKVLLVQGSVLRTQMVLATRHGVSSMRTVNTCLKEVLTYIAHKKGISYTEAQVCIQEKGLLKKRTDERRIVVSYLDTLITEVRCFIKQRTFSPDCIVLTGALAHIDGVNAYMAKKIKLPVRTEVKNASTEVAHAYIAVRTARDMRNELYGCVQALLPITIRRESVVAVFVIAGIISMAGSTFYIHGNRRVRAYEADLVQARVTLEERAGVSLNDFADTLFAYEKFRRSIAAGPTVVIGPTPTGWVHARTGPGTEYAIRTRLLEGEVYTNTNTRFGWYELYLVDGSSVWVYGDYITHN